ncbi:glycoside hydrolase family 3 protein [Maribellus maritimus]|uniref:glycoside hydrolase family 3 protein n=1 Tax=Maribellus maritimus TaxID=2870838 RepID=UPI001EEBC0D5|nr:glycoside hydrolase family 3 N-terminal domain-containing protein [Maribellus maritimus]MCG6187259.1 glycoside hydrolase family 3 C-terminal domain-containing protein [Maribellus maritimus]
MKNISILILLFILSNSSILLAQGTYSFQPNIEARAVNLLHEDKLEFKDLNKNGKLDVYEDWRKPVENRIQDLLDQMTLEEKVGFLLINTLNAETYGKVSESGVRYVEDEKMTRFIFRNTVIENPERTGGRGGGFGGGQVSPYEAAQFTNSVQEIAENTRLGIPVVFKSNARNHVTYDARAGINVGSGAFSAWPKEAGLAATQDIELIAEFANVMRQEWTSIGLRSMYGYMADLATEPRWYRIHETFTEDSEWATEIVSTLIKNLQGESLNSKSVALTLKHFPGGGPQEGGGDPHFDYGKNQVYPAGMFDYHVAPFKAAIDAGVSSIMPYYGIPIGQRYLPNDVGMAFSKGIVTGLLRNELGFKGYVNSDTGIIGDRAWGLEDKTEEEQIIIAVEAGTDVLSGFSNNKMILDLVESGKITESRVELSVRRQLREQFELGLFENPYVDPDRAAYIVGNASFQRKADIAQRKSIVLLQNKMNLPLAMPERNDSLVLFTMGVDNEIFNDRAWSGIKAISGDYDAENGQLPEISGDVDYAVIRVNVLNTGGRFGGAIPEELDLLAFSDMVGSKSWHISPSLADIKTVMDKVGAEKTILSVNFRNPYVLDESCGFLDAGAILATFGVKSEALMDIIMGNFKPTGKLPFALAKSKEAIINQDSDAPGYPDEDTLFPFGFGLTY